LDSLKEHFPELLADCETREFSGTDYAYRIFVEKATWTRVLVGLNEELDYDNFKSAVGRYQGSQGQAYKNALHDVWDVMYQVQK
tara:strand:- start:231 stop:482 length:252 start_codon:yes stop_codon:yes gene_type:complete